MTVARREWVAVVDTGFNGDLELPDRLRDSLDANYMGRLISRLAGARTVEEDLYGVEFRFDGRTVACEATFVPGEEILLGTHLLRDHRLEVDFVGRTVRLDRAS